MPFLFVRNKIFQKLHVLNWLYIVKLIWKDLSVFVRMCGGATLYIIEGSR